MGRKESWLWILGLGLLVFFGAWGRQGLQPDAALYAGLARKILITGESWRLAGSRGYFPLFFEHPPYFFQWGAGVLRVLDDSDGAARATGGIPGCLGYLAICFWAWARLGRQTALWTAFMLATFGHYTKFAATSMLEGPLSLGVTLSAIGIYEIVWGAKRFRALSYLVFWTGLVGATAAKGVAGLGAWGASALVVAHAVYFGSRLRHRYGRSAGLLAVALAFSLSPLLYWGWHMFSTDAVDWFAGYLVQQVFRSATSTRGDLSHAAGGSPLFYVHMIFTQAWPWWWTVPACAACVFMADLKARTETEFRTRTGAAFLLRFDNLVLRRWMWVSLFFFVAYFVPFSLVAFQLAHYIHPVYAVLAPVGAYFMAQTANALTKRFQIGSTAKLRWTLLVLAVPALLWTNRGVTSTVNRGQEWASVAGRVNALPAACEVVVRALPLTDPYRMEAYSLWYWHARAWRILDERLTPRANQVLWDPATAALAYTAKCPAPGVAP